MVPFERVFSNPVDEVIVFSFGYMDEIRKALEPFVKKGGQITSLLDLLRTV